jgi:glycosyltransferase involved in cell wall biosynthesis
VPVAAIAESWPEKVRHVLLVSPQPFYQDRGTPIAVRHVIMALAQEGWNVDLLTYPLGESVDLPRARVFRFGRWLGLRSIPIGLSLRKLLLDALMLGAIWRRTREQRYACIHAVEESIYPALFVAWIRRLPVIYDMHSSLAEQLSLTWARFFVPTRFAAWCERLACDKSASVVCSIGLARKILENRSTAVAREWRFPDDWRPPIAPRRAALDAELDLAPEARIVMYAGNFEPYQGIDLLLACIPEVVSQCPEAAFVLIGANPASLGDIGARYAELMRAGKLRVLARRSRAETLDFLRMAEIAVSPKISGANLPLKLFDYLAAGLPVVATRVEAHLPMDGKGLIYTDPTPSGLAEGIARMLTDRVLAETHRASARSAAAAELTWPQFQSQVADLYRDAVGAQETLHA